MTDFEKFPKIPRTGNFKYLVTEKIDGTNAQVSIEKIGSIEEYGEYIDTESCCVSLEKFTYHVQAGSRNRWITPGNDNFGFASYVWKNAKELLKLGPGRHFGEWYGKGIQRGYGLEEKRFALFNAGRWTEVKEMTELGITDAFPSCNVDVVPILGNLSGDIKFQPIMEDLHKNGSYLVPGFLNPEGIIIHNSKHGFTFKETFEFTEGKWKEE